jgi:hypothetical protein
MISGLEFWTVFGSGFFLGMAFGFYLAYKHLKAIYYERNKKNQSETLEKK